MRPKRKQAAASPRGPAGDPAAASAGDSDSAASKIALAATSSAAAAAAAAAPDSALYHDIANRAELHANAQHVWSMIHAARPKNTRMAYTPKQKEFQVGSGGGTQVP